MTKQSSLFIAGQTYLIYLSSANCSKAFFDDACKKYYQLKLLNSLNSYQVNLHGYSILDNEVYLLGTSLSPTGFAALISYLNRAYTEYYNVRFERCLKSWSEPSKASLIQGNQLVLDCQKYIERKCLEERALDHPGVYEFSSYCSNSFGIKSKKLTPHAAFCELMTNTANPYRHYRDFISVAFPIAYQMYLDKNLKHGRPLAKRDQPLAIPVAVRRKACPEFFARAM